MSNARNLANLLGTGTTIGTSDIADDAITNAKIANDAVTGAKIEDNPTIAGNLTIAGDTTAQGTTVGFTTFDKLLLNATDGSATDAGDNLILNGTDATSANADSSILFDDATRDPNFFKIAGSEYFQVNLTTDITGLGSGSTNVVDFGGSGTVEHDTASNFDSANDAYLLDSSDGVYMVSFCIGIRANTITSENIAVPGAAVMIATDGSNYVAYKGAAEQTRDNASNDVGSVILNNTFIYRATTATTKLRISVYSAQAGSATYNIETNLRGMLQNSAGDPDDATVTFLSVMRIA